MAQQIFRRQETKYILSEQQVADLLWLIEPYLKQDKYFKGTNCSIYYDDDHWHLAIASREKPLYKEKLRVRSYGVPRPGDTVFVEIKKKYKGIGSKRRIPVKLEDFEYYVKTGEWRTSPSLSIKGSTPAPVSKPPASKTLAPAPASKNPAPPSGQSVPTPKSPAPLSPHDRIIKAELDECFRRYRLRPRMFLAYDRTSYCDKDDPTFRVTFDRNVRRRTRDLSLAAGDSGDLYFQHGEVVMEVKALDRYPLWFVRALSKLKIYPANFSKYGRTVEEELKI